MSVWIDKTYINNISHTLHNFKWKSSVLANCSCPICEDSKTNKNKARGYFFIISDGYRYICHNCAFSATFSFFLKTHNTSLYREYVVDTYKENNQYHSPAQVEERTMPISTDMVAMAEKRMSPLSALVSVSSLDSDHIAHRYVSKRKIPMDDIYFCDNYFRWANTITPEKNYNESVVQMRIIFPFRDAKGQYTGHSARALSAEHVPKYYTHKAIPSAVFGMDRIDFSKRIYVVEGQIDSLFIDNCVAAASSALHKVHGIPKNNSVLIPDADIRNKDIMKLVHKFIVDGHMVCMLPQNQFPFKDINEAIMAGMQKNDIMDIIDANTYSGMAAMLKFKNWRKDE